MTRLEDTVLEVSHKAPWISAELLTNEDKERVFIHAIVEIFTQIRSWILPWSILNLLVEIVARMQVSHHLAGMILAMLRVSSCIAILTTAILELVHAHAISPRRLT